MSSKPQCPTHGTKQLEVVQLTGTYYYLQDGGWQGPGADGKWTWVYAYQKVGDSDGTSRLEVTCRACDWAASFDGWVEFDPLFVPEEDDDE